MKKATLILLAAFAAATSSAQSTYSLEPRGLMDYVDGTTQEIVVCNDHGGGPAWNMLAFTSPRVEHVGHGTSGQFSTEPAGCIDWAGDQDTGMWIFAASHIYENGARAVKWSPASSGGYVDLTAISQNRVVTGLHYDPATAILYYVDLLSTKVFALELIGGAWFNRADLAFNLHKYHTVPGDLWTEDGTVFWIVEREPAQVYAYRNGVVQPERDIPEGNMEAMGNRHPYGIVGIPDTDSLYVTDTLTKLVHRYDIPSEVSDGGAR